MYGRFFLYIHMLPWRNWQYAGDLKSSVLETSRFKSEWEYFVRMAEWNMHSTKDRGSIKIGCGFESHYGHYADVS